MHHHHDEYNWPEDVGVERYFRRAYVEYEHAMADMALSEKMNVSPKSRDSKGESVESSPVASPNQDHSRQKLQRSPQSNSSSSGYNGSESSTEPIPATFMDGMDSPQSQAGSCHTQSTYIPVGSNRSPGSDVSQDSTNMSTVAVKEENPTSPHGGSTLKSVGRGYPGIFLATTGSSLAPQGANPPVTLHDSWNIGSVPLQQNAILDLTTRHDSPHKDSVAYPGLVKSNSKKFGLLGHGSAQDDREDSPLAKRLRLLDSKHNGVFNWQPQSPTNATASSSSSCSDNNDLKRRRFMRTREALERSGLLNVTMRTADLIKSNYVLNKQIEELKCQTAELLRSIFDCKENEKASNALNLLQVISDQSRDSQHEPV